MSENKMQEVAKLLGLKLGEEFTIKGVNSSYRFKLTAIGLMSSWKNSSKWNSSGLLEEFITGNYQISKVVNSVLDPAEKRYLANIIKPFRNRVISIAKSETVTNYDNPNPKIYECIYILYKDSSKKRNPFYMGFPRFEKGTMYKGMKVNREYTLEQLGL